MANLSARAGIRVLSTSICTAFFEHIVAVIAVTSFVLASIAEVHVPARLR
jgi:hypothetical protein